MEWGLPHAPKPAWAVIILGLAASAVMLPFALGRGDLSADEIQQIQDKARVPASETTGPALPPPEVVERPAGEPLRVLFAGDSITVGAYAMTREENFRNLVTTALSTGGEVDPVRIGDSGLATAEVLPEVAGAGSADVALVELGTNDVFKSTPEQFSRDYPAFLDAVRQQSPDAVLLCAGIWGEPTLAAQGMDVTVQRECEARGGQFVSLREEYADPANRGPAGTIRPLDGEVLDDFHPNSEGHAAIAAALLERLDY